MTTAEIGSKDSSHHQGATPPKLFRLHVKNSTQASNLAFDTTPAAMGKKRTVLAAAEESLSPPDALKPNQSLVRVIKPEGNNLYTCELPNKKPVLLELAQRFRNTIWIKRGGFVLAERYEGDASSSRAEGEIVNVVRDEKTWRKQPYWYTFRD